MTRTLDRVPFAALAFAVCAVPLVARAQTQVAPPPSPAPGYPAPYSYAPAPVPPAPLPPPPPGYTYAPIVGYAQPTSAYAPSPAPPNAPAVAPDHVTGAPSGEGSLRGAEIGLRTGIALPNGSILPGLSLGDVASNHVPIWVDLGYRFTDRFAFGAYAQYGILNVKCDTGLDCSGFDARVGLQFHAHFQPRASTDPWVGVGSGYELLLVDVSGSQSTTVHFDGFELVNLQGGIDWRASPALTLGPFASVTASQFSKASNGHADADIANSTMHEWFTLGVRGVIH